MPLADILTRELAGILSLSPAQLQALSAHYELLVRWNRKMNLTTVTALPEAAIRHYCESLFLGTVLTAGTVVDVGSGAGFPGIPVAIGRPDCRVDLVESNQRKAVFLREAVRELPNVRVIASRAEEIVPNVPYDWMISRAVSPAELMRLRVATRFAILVGEGPYPDSQVTRLPWGDQRFLVTGPIRFT